jgi:hypothetical protein
MSLLSGVFLFTELVRYSWIIQIQLETSTSGCLFHQKLLPIDLENSFFILVILILKREVTVTMSETSWMYHVTLYPYTSYTEQLNEGARQRRPSIVLWLSNDDLKVQYCSSTVYFLRSEIKLPWLFEYRS